MDLRDFLRTIRRHWTVIVAVFALFMIVGAGYTLTQKPTYTASAQMFVATGSNDSVNDQAQGAQFVQQVVRSYAGLATQAFVLEPVIRDLDLDTTVGALAQNVSAQVPAETQLLTITAEARTPRDAARIADSVASNLSTAVDRLSPAARQAISASPVQLPVTDPAWQETLKRASY